MRLLAPFVIVPLALLIAAPVPAEGANPWLKRRVLNLAHQGGESEFPSNTMFAFRRALRAGADGLELDVGVTRDNEVVVMHDTSVDRTTNGRGLISSKTLEQVRRLDAAYWFAPEVHCATTGSESCRDKHYSHKLGRRAYRFRGVATGDSPPPPGFTAADFRVPTLREVLEAFPNTPINIEIKGRTRQENVSEYVRNAEVLARVLRGERVGKIIVASFKDAALERFHELLPRIGLNSGQDATTGWVLFDAALPAGTVAIQVPITYDLEGTPVAVATPENIARAHRQGFAWHSWFSGLDVDGPAAWRQQVEWCADGIMTSRPARLERVLRSHGPPADCPSG